MALLQAGSVHPREVRMALHVSRALMARLLGVSGKTIERWEMREQPPATEPARYRLQHLQAIAELGRLVYTAEGLASFLSTPLACFAGHTAVQEIELGRADRVLAALAADYEGSQTS